MRSAIRRWLLELAVLLFVIGAGGLLVAVSGIIPIKASSGHWAITAWFLDFAKTRSIATHTITMPEPQLAHDWLVLKGAGHYEGGCRPCHGIPGARQPRIGMAMTPQPPELSPLIGEREPKELFYAVKHGIKFTAMPAWPAQMRDDEVGAIVAFLLELPALDADSYRALVHGEFRDATGVPPLQEFPATEPVPPLIATSCARCHGIDGRGRRLAAFPKLAGQKPAYLFAALEAYATGRRHSGIMEPIAVALTARQWDETAAHYGSLPRGVAAHADTVMDNERAQRGRDIAERGIPAQGVPSCRDCHGPGSHRRNAHYPDLAGQFADYLVLQLELFKEERRGGSAYAHLMRHVATRLTDEQMGDVAAYYESLDER